MIRAPRQVVIALVIAALLQIPTHTHAATRGRCGGLETGTCGVSGGTSQFHGLIAVNGAPWVFGAAMASGTQAGCGDCTWTLVLACLNNSPGNPTGDDLCTAALRAAKCRRGQSLYRLYLTTNAFADRVEGSLCLGGGEHVIPVGDRAAGDVQRYLKNVTPPDLVITTRPRAATLAGLPTYFAARPPALAPAPFGGPMITETISIRPVESDWQWGDGSASGWAASASNLIHSYLNGGRARGLVLTRWGATYTITYAGQTAGPYDAVGQLTRRQSFTLPVRTSSPILVSH